MSNVNALILLASKAAIKGSDALATKDTSIGKMVIAVSISNRLKLLHDSAKFGCIKTSKADAINTLMASVLKVIGKTDTARL